MSFAVPDSLFSTDDADLPRVFGWSTEINLGGCDLHRITDRDAVADWGPLLCEQIGMTPYGEPMIEQFGTGDLHGITAVISLHQHLGFRNVQRLTTSAAVMHCDPTAHGVHIDIFSCKMYDPRVAAEFSAHHFAARCGTSTFRIRRVPSLLTGFQFAAAPDPARAATHGSDTHS